MRMTLTRAAKAPPAHDLPAKLWLKAMRDIGRDEFGQVRKAPSWPRSWANFIPL
jgi:hypothetical protein